MKVKKCLRCGEITTFCECEKSIYDKDEYIKELEKQVENISLNFDKYIGGISNCHLLDGINHIEDALYATGKFTTEQCTMLTEGIMQYIQDAGYALIRVDNN